MCLANLKKKRIPIVQNPMKSWGIFTLTNSKTIYVHRVGPSAGTLQYPDHLEIRVFGKLGFFNLWAVRKLPLSGTILSILS
jgi:hypothetical protein